MASGKFKGTSHRGNVNEAIAEAVAAAKTGLRSSLVSWKLDGVSGENGGFVLVNDVTVRITARSGPAGGGKSTTKKGAAKKGAAKKSAAKKGAAKAR